MMIGCLMKDQRSEIYEGDQRNDQNQISCFYPPRVGAMAKLALVFLLLITFYSSCFAYDLYVDSEADPSGATGSIEHPYVAIQHAIDHALNDSLPYGTNVIIIVNNNPTVYQENLNINYGTPANPHNVIDITIQSELSDPETCVIEALNDSLPVITVKGRSDCKLKLSGFTIRFNSISMNEQRGVFLDTPTFPHGYFHTMDVDNCIFNNCTKSVYAWGDVVAVTCLRVSNSKFNLEQVNAPPAGILAPQIGYQSSSAYIKDNVFIRHDPDTFVSEAIHFGSGYSVVEIEGNKFQNVQIYSDLQPDSQNIVVNNNEFNESYLTFASRGNWTITHNKFIGLSSPSDPSVISLFVNVSYLPTECIINSNLFYNCFLPLEVGFPYSSHTSGIVNVALERNSFINCGGILSLQRLSDMQSSSNSVSLYRNNLYYGTSNAPFVVIDQNNDPLVLTGDRRIPVSYSHFSASLTAPSSLLLDNPSISYGDPGIVIDDVNHTYTLAWNNSIRSPLIMAGHGNEGLGTPYHANRLDIGAVQYSEHPHEFVSYTFPPYSERNGFKWMSFPTLDRIWNPAMNEPDVAQIFFSPLMNNMILHDIAWKVEDDNPQAIQFVNNEWTGYLTHQIIPQQGYKIQMAQGLQNPQNISVPGIIPQVAQYPLAIKAHLSSQQTGIDNENWLGYFNQNSTHVRDAFVGIIDNLWSIQTQNWTMVRDKPMPGRPWIYALQQGKEPTLSYGDMVIVKCFSDDQFIWNVAAPSQLPVEKELPEYYEYEEKPDYVPLYVELDIHNLPKEIALYVDDVCKGAAVVTDSLVEIPAYILDWVDPNAIIELRCVYDDKAAVDQIPAYRVWNPNSNSYENKALTLNRKNYYYRLKLDQNSENSPALPKTAMSVYPNPFNPSTTIRFSLPVASKIQLEIYNQKGQLVKSLAQGNVDSGWHSKVWNGTDNQNRRVASGLYYSKLNINGKRIVKKMVLLK